ncbi:MAG: hypothetical protein MI923_08270 [Phycisphaerales bacterium]|nr:hypothetical protein [Phycisphaerales bacterium]
MENKKLTNLADGSDPRDAVTRKQLDNAGVGDITADIDLKNSYNIQTSAKRTFTQLKADTKSLVSYEEVKENFIGVNEAEAMKTYLDMGDNYIYNVKKFGHRYFTANNNQQFMYYHRMIINFLKTVPSHPYFLHILVNIPQDGNDLKVYPKNFTAVYIIAYGIMGSVSNIDPDKVYDYHTAFDIRPTEVSFNVDINANSKAIRNIQLERNSCIGKKDISLSRKSYI